MKVFVTAYKKYIIIEPHTMEEAPDFIPVTQSGQIGSTVLNTKENLGISNEAWALIKSIKKSGDDIGEIMTCIVDNGTTTFSWIGPLYGIFDSNMAESDSMGIVDIPFIEIPNNVPNGALKVITEIEGKADKEER